MRTNNRGITGHMVVKNEDRFVYFAISSVLPYLDQLLITDTGSTDNTIKIIESIKSDKISLTRVHVNNPAEVTAVRQSQLEATKTPWFWLIDGDEIYPQKTAEEVVNATQHNFAIIAVRRYDLLGDIYHAQKESVGTYELYGQRGHLVTRLFNRDKLPGLNLAGDYPNEGYYLGDQRSTLDIPRDNVYVTSNKLFHAMYLQRSSLRNDLAMFNRNKYKIELGQPIASGIPEVFGKYPTDVTDPNTRRGLSYELLASLITPIKNLKRALT